MRAPCWSRRPGLPRRRPDRCMRSSSASGLGGAIRSPPWRWLASWPSCAGTFSPRRRTISGRDPRWWPTRSGRWSCRPVSRPRRETDAVRPMPTTSRSSGIGRCSSPTQAERAYEHFVGQWRPRGPGRGARAPQSGQARMIRRPGEACSRCPALRHEVARAEERLARSAESRLSISSVLCSLARCWAGKLM